MSNAVLKADGNIRIPAALRKAMEKGFAADVTTLIEVPAGVMPDPWSLIRLPRNRPAKP